MKFAFALLTAAVLVPVLNGNTIYDNFSAENPSFNTGSGEVIVSDGIDQRPSFMFSVGTAEYLTEVDFVTSVDVNNTANQVTISLFPDDSGAPNTTMAALASQTFTGMMGIEGSTDDPPGTLTWTPSVEPLLAADTPYWITFDAPANGGDVFWNDNQTFASGDSTFGSGHWTATSNTLGALEIIGSTTAQSTAPEPTSFAFLCAALVGALAARKRFLPK